MDSSDLIRLAKCAGDIRRRAAALIVNHHLGDQFDGDIEGMEEIRRALLHAAGEILMLRSSGSAEDALRYRWLRENCRVTAEARGGCPEHAALVYYYGLKTPDDAASYTAEGLDAAIDAKLYRA